MQAPKQGCATTSNWAGPSPRPRTPRNCWMRKPGPRPGQRSTARWTWRAPRNLDPEQRRLRPAPAGALRRGAAAVPASTRAAGARNECRGHARGALDGRVDLAQPGSKRRGAADAVGARAGNRSRRQARPVYLRGTRGAVPGHRQPAQGTALRRTQGRRTRALNPATHASRTGPKGHLQRRHANPAGAQAHQRPRPSWWRDLSTSSRCARARAEPLARWPVARGTDTD